MESESSIHHRFCKCHSHTAPHHPNWTQHTSLHHPNWMQPSDLEWDMRPLNLVYSRRLKLSSRKLNPTWIEHATFWSRVKHTIIHYTMDPDRLLSISQILRKWNSHTIPYSIPPDCRNLLIWSQTCYHYAMHPDRLLSTAHRSCAGGIHPLLHTTRLLILWLAPWYITDLGQVDLTHYSTTPDCLLKHFWSWSHDISWHGSSINHWSCGCHLS